MAASPLLTQFQQMGENYEDVPPGIPRLIQRWLDAEPSRSPEAFGELLGLHHRTVYRWKAGRVPKLKRDREGYRDQLLEIFDVSDDELDEAWRQSDEWRANEPPRMARTGVPAELSVTRWVEAVRRDQDLSAIAKVVLEAITYYPISDDLFGVEWGRLANETGLTDEEVRDAIPSVLHSGYVRRLTALQTIRGEWVLKLEMPG